MEISGKWLSQKVLPKITTKESLDDNLLYTPNICSFSFNIWSSTFPRYNTVNTTHAHMPYTIVNTKWHTILIVFISSHTQDFISINIHNFQIIGLAIQHTGDDRFLKCHWNLKCRPSQEDDC